MHVCHGAQVRLLWFICVTKRVEMNLACSRVCMRVFSFCADLHFTTYAKRLSSSLGRVALLKSGCSTQVLRVLHSRNCGSTTASRRSWTRPPRSRWPSRHHAGAPSRGRSRPQWDQRLGCTAFPSSAPRVPASTGLAHISSHYLDGSRGMHAVLPGTP